MDDLGQNKIQTFSAHNNKKPEQIWNWHPHKSCQPFSDPCPPAALRRHPISAVELRDGASLMIFCLNAVSHLSRNLLDVSAFSPDLSNDKAYYKIYIFYPLPPKKIVWASFDRLGHHESANESKRKVFTWILSKSIKSVWACTSESDKSMNEWVHVAIMSKSNLIR